MQKLTTESFIQQARTAHGQRYDYTKAVYLGSQLPVTITCHDHGDFPQRANSHLSGSGCPSCKNRKQP